MEKVLVIGHRNPDTDAICSAICYAYYKNRRSKNSGGIEYVPYRAGSINEETKYVLERFGIESPEYITDVATQVKDIEIVKTPGVSRTISLKKAWALMRELNVYTLPVVRSGKLEGVITTEDIAKAYMDVYDNAILSTAHTKFQNVIETVEGRVLAGNPEKYFTKGKCVIASTMPEILQNYIEKDDLVILGNRTENQLLALEKQAECMIICDGAKVEDQVLERADAQDCVVISTNNDAFTVARLINQSMPISYFMKREGLVFFHDDDFTEDIRAVMAKKRYRDFPILDKHSNYLGMMSRRDLLNARKKKIILVDHNELTQAVDGLGDAEIIEIIDHHRLGSIETVSPLFYRAQPLGCTATIIYQMMMENDVPIPPNIAGLMLSAIISDTLMYRSPTCTQYDKEAAENLALIAGVDVVKHAEEMFKAGSNMKNKSAEEIFYQDFKKFTVEGTSFGIGQITAMTDEELATAKDKVVNYLDHAYKELGVGSVYLLLTNIYKETSEVVFAGDEADRILMEAFHYQRDQGPLVLPGVVSRKKQFLPEIMKAVRS